MRMLMRSGIWAALAGLALAGNAATALAQSPSPVIQHKEMILSRLRQEAAIIERAASCVQVAANDDGLRLCMQQRRAAEEAMRHQGQLR